jgi:hypothetical protein
MKEECLRKDKKKFDYDGLCHPGYHKFVDACAGLFVRKGVYVPVEYCVYCGLIRAKLK